MPRHKDNVDVVLVANPRPSRGLSGDFGLNVPAPFDHPAWWGLTPDDSMFRVFRAEAGSSKLRIFADVVCNGLLQATVEDPFGERVRIIGGDPRMSEFKWKSTANHVVTLSLGAELDGTSLEVKCLDPSPAEPVWEFRIGDANKCATFIADFSSTTGPNSHVGIASFIETHAR